MKKKEYIAANKAWLTAKSREADVKALPKGIYYKVLTEAKAGAKQPNARSIITVHYTGYTIDGQCFDSSREGVAPAFRLSELIEGWIIALQQMHEGERWELYLPAELAYGKYDQPGIPGGSTLIFDIELLSVM
nr:FKBP-type peptidyl-prolyl cis-trans isomerase [uncultured Porphyromonas sp.]